MKRGGGGGGGSSQRREKNVSLSENVPINRHKMSRFRSPCACAKYHRGLCSPFIQSVVSNDSVCG